MKVFFIALTILIINTPFGYWRANVKKFSKQWVLAIHIPVIIGIAERIASHLEFSWASLLVFVAVFFLGQYAGGKIYQYMKDFKHYPVTSCLCIDYFRFCLKQC